MGLCASAPADAADAEKFTDLSKQEAPAKPSAAAAVTTASKAGSISTPPANSKPSALGPKPSVSPSAVSFNLDGTHAQERAAANGAAGPSSEGIRQPSPLVANISSRSLCGASSRGTQQHDADLSIQARMSEGDRTEEHLVASSSTQEGNRQRTQSRESLETLQPKDLTNLAGEVDALERSIMETSTLKKVMVSGKMMLNQYMVMKTLGKGSFGTVRLCFNLNDKKLYAIKTLNKKQLTRTRGLKKQRNADPLDDLKREIAVMKKLKHPNLVKLYEVIDDPVSTKLLMVMEHVQGGPIMPENSANCMSEQVVVHYFRDMCMGLDYLHFNYISHGDLKPDNMLLSAGGDVKITDFGCSRVLDSADELVSRTTGTPVFYAPEMTRREPAQELYTSIANDELTFPKSRFVSEELRDLLSQMLDKDPEDRIQLPEIMGHPWVTQGGMFMINSLQHLQNPPAVLTVDDDAEESDAIRSDTCVALMAPIFEEVQFKSGEYLIRSGEKHDVVFYINSGQAEVIKMVSTMRQNGHVTGELSRERVSGSQQDTVESTMFSQDDWSCFDVANPNSSMVNDMYKSLDNLQVVHFEHVVRTISSGSFVGTVEELDCLEYLADDISVLAKGPLTALAIQKNDLMQFLASRPEIEKAIRGRMAQAKTEKLVQKTIKQVARDMSKGKEASRAR
eukprot:jgi/Tetstr1/442904/TSEL_030967.t1